MRTTVRSADKGAAAAAGLVATAGAEAAARGAREREPATGEGRRRMLDGGEGDRGKGMTVESSRAASIADISARSLALALGSCRGEAPVPQIPIGGDESEWGLLTGSGRVWWTGGAVCSGGSWYW